MDSTPGSRPQVANLRLSGLGWDNAQGPVIASLTADLPSGLVYVTGDERTGKSSLLRLLAGQLRPARGDIVAVANGQVLAPGDLAAMTALSDPHNDALDALSVSACLAQARQRYPRWQEALWEDLQQELGLTPHLCKSVFMLSAGTKRKLWLATVMAAGTPVTLLDEPFAALDNASIRVVTDLLQEVSAHPSRMWVVADYEVPEGLTPDAVVALPA